jgi:hypothetical protein
MADLKISQLTGATTPLAGSEVLPIVQSGATKQVSVANLTAGRAVSVAGLTSTSNVTLSTNATYFRGVTSGAATTRMLGINSGNTVYIGSIDTQTAGGVIFINGTEFMNVDTSNNVTFSAGNLVQGTAGKGINFTANTNAPGMTSELLNWYEEGTWTPTIRFSGGSTGVTYSTQSGTYTRVGRQVTLNFDVRLSNKGSSTGVWEIGGFPFTAGAEGHGNLHFQSGGAGINQLAAIRITSGSTYGGLYYALAGATLNYAETDATNGSICIGQIIFFV